MPPSDGGAQVMHFTTQGLLINNIDVKTLAINPTRIFIDKNTLPQGYKKATRFECVIVDTNIKPIQLLTNLLKKESYFIERFISKDFDNKLHDILIHEEFDIIQLEHLYLCKYINTIRAYSKAKIVLRPQNIEYIIWERFLKGVKNPIKKFLLSVSIKRLKKYEQSVNSQLDGIMALTNDDAAVFSSFSNVPSGVVVPMGYDYEKIVGYDHEKQFLSSPVVYHLGTMDWLPNEEAVKWFLEKVLPLIKDRKIKFILAGKKMPKWVHKYESENLAVLDEIKKPLEFQEDKLVMIVPLLSGSGIRAKIIEGLALGKTIVSTTIGAQGIEYENGKNILIADSEEEFANQIVRSVNSVHLCREIGENAKKLSILNYHYENTAKKMIAFYRYLLEK
jgi:glycosyltransferase involved in cell wall biosynthesis